MHTEDGKLTRDVIQKKKMKKKEEMFVWDREEDRCVCGVSGGCLEAAWWFYNTERKRDRKRKKKKRFE